MALTHEAIRKYQLFHVGDTKIANYDISFTANQLVEAETGWFLLNGAVISQSTYPKLYALYGSTFNTGSEGAGNFRLPDQTTNVPIGKGVTNFTSYGINGGEQNHALSSTELPSHTHSSTLGVSANSHGHSGSCTADNGGGHTHTYSLGSYAAVGPAGGVIILNGYGSPAGSGGGGSVHSHANTSLSYGSGQETYSKSGSVSSAGSGTAHNNMMPYIVVGGILVKHD
jgi:microcystin-dependent protein